MVVEFPNYVPRTLHKADLSGTTDYSSEPMPREVTTDLLEATVISSVSTDDPDVHYPVLDIDVRAHLVPSSTSGHTHLYLDHPLTPDQLWKLCDVMAEVGILEPGYVSACKERGYTSVRLPWIKKEKAA